MTRTVAAVVASAAVAAGLTAIAAAPAQSRPAGESGPLAHASQETGRRFTSGGRLGFGRVYEREQRLPRGLRESLELRFSTVNPADPDPPRGPVPGPTRPVLGDSEVDPRLDRFRRLNPRRGVRPPDPRAIRRGRAPARTAGTPRARAAAPDDFALWRNEPVAQGAGITGTVAEPTVANDRNALLFTGNFHAAISSDNGLNWSYLNPATQFSSLNGGFCCDQVAYAVDRGGYSLVFWLLQYSDDGTTGGSLRLVVYQGRSELLQQANYCEHVIRPSRIGETGAKWFDFNVMAATDEHLFLSTKLFNSSGAGGGFVTGAVIRWDLDDLDDGDCSLDSGRYWKNADGGKQNTALAQGADSIMYWGKKTANGQLDIWSLPDNSNTATRFTKQVSPWATSGRGSSSCPVPDGTDPCARANDLLNVAFLHQGAVTFAWNVAQRSGFAFPHIRMARFHPATLDLLDEPDVFNQGYAWVYPAAGVNAAGDLGLTLYRIGGGSFPRARVALVDRVDPSIDSLNVHGVITSDAGTLDPTGNTLGRWGDYGAVRAYGNCENTFAGTVHSQQGGNLNQNSEHRFIWFGRERYGCADLVVDAVGFLPYSVDRGDDLYIGETTFNTGSASAGASVTRFYLSRDSGLSNDDLRLSEVAEHRSLDPADSEGLAVVATVPNSASGSYYLIACADDRTDVTELTDTNNCRDAGILDVRRGRAGSALPWLGDISIPSYGAVAQGAGFRVRASIRRPSRAGLRHRPSAGTGRAVHLSLWLSRTGRRTRGARLVAARALPATRGADRKARRMVRTLRVRVPRATRPGDYRVIFCIDRTRRTPGGARCLASRETLHVIAARRR